MNRRELLFGTTALALVGAGGAMAACPVPSASRPFRDLPEQRSVDKVLSAELRMTQEKISIGTDKVFELATYGGEMPGKVFRLRAGDTLKWTLKNRMDRDIGLPLDNGDPTACQKELNYTNVHTHGLQVSPKDGHDNVYIVVKPGKNHDYSYKIPGPETGRPQPAGMNWYHPHKHGSTSHQAWQGLAGPIIIEGDIDEVPEVKAARERVMVLNELLVAPQNLLAPEVTYATPTATIVPTAGDVPFTSIRSMPTDIIFPINGIEQPDIDIRPGETQRWRVLAAGPHRFFDLKIEEHPIYQISQDGVPFAAARKMEKVLLAPGNRAEFIVKGGAPGRYCVKALQYDQGHPGGPRPEKILGWLVVGGAKMDGKLPGRLVDPPVIPPDAAEGRKGTTIAFKGDILSTPVKFYLDGKVFSATRLDQTVRVGTWEDWLLVNEDVFQHPFHIHVNPFQVIEIDGKPVAEPVWWDTIALPPRKPDGTPGKVKIRIYFRPDINGVTVYHCHILPHEDNGMMANIYLEDPSVPFKDPNGFGKNYVPSKCSESHK